MNVNENYELQSILKSNQTKCAQIYDNQLDKNNGRDEKVSLSSTMKSSVVDVDGWRRPLEKLSLVDVNHWSFLYAAKKDCLDSDTLPLWLRMVGSEAVCGGLIAHILSLVDVDQ